MNRCRSIHWSILGSKRFPAKKTGAPPPTPIPIPPQRAKVALQTGRLSVSVMEALLREDAANEHPPITHTPHNPYLKGRSSVTGRTGLKHSIPMAHAPTLSLPRGNSREDQGLLFTTQTTLTDNGILSRPQFPWWGVGEQRFRPCGKAGREDEESHSPAWRNWFYLEQCLLALLNAGEILLDSNYGGTHSSLILVARIGATRNLI